LLQKYNSHTTVDELEEKIKSERKSLKRLRRNDEGIEDGEIPSDQVDDAPSLQASDSLSKLKEAFLNVDDSKRPSNNDNPLLKMYRLSKKNVKKDEKAKQFLKKAKKELKLSS
jgi:hypothetical protein